MSSVHIRMHKIWKCGNQTRYLKKKKKLKPSCYISNANNQILNIEHWTTFFVYNFLDSKFPLSLLKKKKKKFPLSAFRENPENGEHSIEKPWSRWTRRRNPRFLLLLRLSVSFSHHLSILCLFFFGTRNTLWYVFFIKVQFFLSNSYLQIKRVIKDAFNF